MVDFGCNDTGDGIECKAGRNSKTVTVSSLTMDNPRENQLVCPENVDLDQARIDAARVRKSEGSGGISDSYRIKASVEDISEELEDRGCVNLDVERGETVGRIFRSEYPESNGKTLKELRSEGFDTSDVKPVEGSEDEVDQDPAFQL